MYMIVIKVGVIKKGEQFHNLNIKCNYSEVARKLPITRFCSLQTT